MFLAGNNDIFQLMTPEDSENVKYIALIHVGKTALIT
jgi:hypothetical protein